MDEQIKEMFEKVLSGIKGLEDHLTRIEVGQATVAQSPSPVGIANSRKQSIKEFLIEFAPDGAVQITLAIAYYLETCEGISPFNKDDLEKGFRAAKETIPPNVNDKLYKNIKNGHMMEAEGKKDSMKAWVITRSGEEYVQHKFKKDDSK